jgi:hypothetical protein
LVEAYYWAAAITTLNDPCEAMINTDTYFDDLSNFEIAFRNLNGNDANLSSIRDATLEFLNKALTTGIFSLSKNNDDELMWSHYGAAHHGFCIGYKMHYFKRHLKPFLFDVVEVLYQPIPPDMNLLRQVLSMDAASAIQQLIGIKSIKWENEQEIRIVCNEPGKRLHDFRAIDQIYFGLRMSESHKEHLMAALKGRGITYFQMEMSKGAYKFTARPIADEYPEAPRYLYKIAPVSDSAIDENSLQPRFKHLASYLKKAVEIARREPYCVEVIMVDFSYTCNDDEPYIFAHCNRTDDSFSNYEYSLLEIDTLFERILD